MSRKFTSNSIGIIHRNPL